MSSTTPAWCAPPTRWAGAGGGAGLQCGRRCAMWSSGDWSSPMTRQCLIEESILGWEELEVEGGPRLQRADDRRLLYRKYRCGGGAYWRFFLRRPPSRRSTRIWRRNCRSRAFRIVDSVGVIGGTNAQFAHNPKDGRIVIIEINPRTSRSLCPSPLRRPAFRLRLISAKLAVGFTPRRS